MSSILNQFFEIKITFVNCQHAQTNCKGYFKPLVLSASVNNFCANTNQTQILYEEFNQYVVKAKNTTLVLSFKKY